MSGMSVGMSAEVPRGGLGGLSVEVPKGSAAGAPGTSTELEVSGIAGGSRMRSSIITACKLSALVVEPKASWFGGSAVRSYAAHGLLAPTRVSSG